MDGTAEWAESRHTVMNTPPVEPQLSASHQLSVGHSNLQILLHKLRHEFCPTALQQQRSPMLMKVRVYPKAIKKLTLVSLDLQT